MSSADLERISSSDCTLSASAYLIPISSADLRVDAGNTGLANQRPTLRYRAVNNLLQAAMPSGSSRQMRRLIVLQW
jgi:hypothetical protein